MIRVRRTGAALALAFLLPAHLPAEGRLPRENLEGRPGPDSVHRAGNRDPASFLDHFARSHFDGVSGDVVFVPAPGVFFTIRKYPRNHGSPWDYDTHVPMAFYGPGQVRRGVYRGPAQTRDIAPTLAAALGLPELPGATARTWREVLAPDRPDLRAVLLVVMDQVGAHDLQRFEAWLPTLTRMRREGADFPEVYLDYVPTFTGVSHAGIATGAPPAGHGIANNFVANPERTAIDVVFRLPEGRVDPSRNQLATLADVLDAAHGNQSAVLTQIYADYAATAVGGHGASWPGGDRDVVVWYDGRSGRPATDPRHYRLPDYVAQRSTDALLARVRALPESSPYRSFGTNAGTLTGTRHYARWEADAMLEMMIREKVGRDAVPDLVQVNLKSTDAFGHQKGHDDPGFVGCLQEVDRFLAAAETLLERRAGAGQFLIAITSDHGLVPDDGLPRYNTDLALWMEAELDRRGDGDGDGGIVGIDGYHVILDHAELAEDGHDVSAVRDLLLRDPHVVQAWTADEVRSRARQLALLD